LTIAWHSGFSCIPLDFSRGILFQFLLRCVLKKGAINLELPNNLSHILIYNFSEMSATARCLLLPTLIYIEARTYE